MGPTPRTPVIDARPRGPRGPLALESVLGRPVLDHLLDHFDRLGLPAAGPIYLHVDEDGGPALGMVGRPDGRRLVVRGDAPDDGAWVLRSDRLYDPARLRRAFQRGDDPETAVFWRLDGPHGLAGAGDELLRRRSFQPLGHYWARGPARWLGRRLAPTRVRPNAVTLSAFALLVGAAGLVAWGPSSWPCRLATAAGLALALVLDTADGHLARLQGTASPFGRWLDGWLDEVADMVLHAAIAWSAHVRAGSVVWLLLGMLYAAGKFVFVAATTGPEAGDDGGPGTPVPAPASSGRAAALVRLAGHADVRWHLWIVLAAFGRLDAALAAYAVYFPVRALAVAGRRAVRRG